MGGVQGSLVLSIFLFLSHLRINFFYILTYYIINFQILAKALIECYEKSKEQGTPLALKVFIAGRNRLENEGAQNLAKFFEVIFFSFFFFINARCTRHESSQFWQGRARHATTGVVGHSLPLATGNG